MADHWYSQTLIGLQGRVRALCRDVRQRNEEYVARQANTCRAELAHLYEYAKQHSIDVLEYERLLVSIETDLHWVEAEIQNKRRGWWNPDTWWGKALRFVVSAVNLVGSLLGLGSLLRLPGGSGPPQLPW